MLPDGFNWRPRYQYAAGELELACEGQVVAMLIRRVDGGWMARLWAHRPMTEPLVTRQCTSFEAGQAGIEIWADRHADQLRVEVAAKRAR